MIEVGPPPKQPLPSGGAAAPPAKPGAAAIPVQLVQPATLPDKLPANGTVPAVVEPGSQASIVGELLQLGTDQGSLTIQSPVALAAGTRVTLQLATIAGRVQLFLIPPRPAAETRNLGKAAIIANAAKPALEALVPGRAVIATVVRAAPRGGDLAPPVAAEPESAAIAATGLAAPGGAPAAAAAATIATPAAALAAAASPEPAAAAPAAPQPAPAGQSTGVAPAVAEIEIAAPAGEEDAVPPAGPLPSAAPPPPAAAASGLPIRSVAAAPLPAPSPAAAQPDSAEPAAPAAPVAAGQVFAGMAAGQQLTLTILSVAPKSSAAAQAAANPGAAAADAQASAPTLGATPTNGAAPARNTGAPLPSAQAAEEVPAPATATATAAKLAPAGAPPPQSPAPPAPVSPAPAAAPAAAAGNAPSLANSGVAAPASPVAIPPADAITVAASVVGNDAAGQPIVETGSVLLVLEAKAPPLGSEILLALPRSQGAAAPAPSAASVFAPLEEAARAATAEGGPLQQAINTLLPRPGPALAAQLALFVGALRQGSAASWLGNAAFDQLDKIGKSRSSQRLAASFRDGAQASAGAERAVGWLSLTLPIADAGVIQPIQLYVQRRRDEEEKGEQTPDADPGRRFLIDFTLTRLGGIQLDGLARAGRLDLIVRTGLPMATGLRGDLDRLFADVTSARGLTGALIFQVAPPVAPIPRTLPQRQAGGILV